MGFRLKLFSLVMVTLFTIGCSDSSRDTPRQELVISASLGQLTNADVTVTTANGAAVDGGTGTIDSSGTATLMIPANTPSPIVVTVSGNSQARYFDESFGGGVDFPGDRSIRAYSRSSRRAVGVTTLTELAAQVASQVGTNVTDEDVDTINESVRQMFAPDVSDILTPPVLVSEANMNQSLGTDEASIYALRLAALATLGAGSDAPALTVLSQLSTDLADGVIDGRGTDGPIANVSYDNFAQAFANAVQLAGATFANSELAAQLDNVTVSTGANLLQQLVDGGLELPSTVVEDISSGGTGNFDLTISGNVTTAGVSAPFSVTLNRVPAPDPGDTSAVTNEVSNTVAGLSGITGLSVTVVNNTASQVTFDVNFDAEQAGSAISVSLRYDYVQSDTSSNPDQGGGSDGSNGGSDGGTDGGSSGGGSGSTDNFCFVGEPTGAATIPEFLSAEIRQLTFSSASDSAPYADGEVRSFTFSGSGLLFIDDTQVASDPVICGGNEREAVWKDATQDLIYSVSDLQGSFNEVNINRVSDKAFLGQFREAEAEQTGPPAALIGLAGTIETQVIESCSGTPCPNETPVGEIVTVIIGDDGSVMVADKMLSATATGATFSDNTSSIEPRLTLSNPGANEGESFTLEIYIDSGAAVAFELSQAESCGDGCSRSKDIYLEATALPDGVAEFFDKVIAAAPKTMTVVADDENYRGSLRAIIRLPNATPVLCQSFELNAAKDRGAVESSRYRPRFSFFSDNTGADYIRRLSRYKKDDASGDETLSVRSGQLVLRGDGTLDYEEGFLTESGFVGEVKDRATSDTAEISTACADFKTVSGTVTSTSSGSVTIELLNAEDTVIGSSATLITAGETSTFSFVVSSGTTFSLRKGFSSPASLTCTIENGSGTVADADITNVSFSCE
ncbi:MAG: hypothetical protein ACE37D_08500 [Pseudomonadales bacterium]